MRYEVRGYYEAGNHRHYTVIATFDNFDDAMECVEMQQEDDRAAAMWPDVHLMEI